MKPKARTPETEIFNKIIRPILSDKTEQIKFPVPHEINTDDANKAFYSRLMSHSFSKIGFKKPKIINSAASAPQNAPL
jgi:hypothetical protein